MCSVGSTAIFDRQRYERRVSCGAAPGQLIHRLVRGPAIALNR
jgi:hypothetical protein